jgi:hypothetical protein
MGKMAKGNGMLGLTFPTALRDEIDKRAGALNPSRSTYAAMIMEEWRRRKCSPVSEPERLMQLAGGSKSGK